MRLLHLSRTPLSNAPWNLSQCLNECGHKSKLILGRRRSYDGRKEYQKGLLASELTRDAAYELVETADIIHFHNFVWDHELFSRFPDLRAVIRRKKRAVQFHSPRNGAENFEHVLSEAGLKKLVVAQYHVRQYPGCTPVPNLVPIWDPLYMPPTLDKWPTKIPVVSYSPSNIMLRGWDDKGYRYVKPTLDKFRGFIEAEIMIDVPYEECISRKRRAHIGIDEFITGSYHLSSLEYLSVGAVTIARLDDLTRKAIATVSPEGAAHLPWVHTSSATFERDLADLVSDSARTATLAKKSRECMENYWSPKTNVAYFENVYGTC